MCMTDCRSQVGWLSTRAASGACPGVLRLPMQGGRPKPGGLLSNFGLLKPDRNPEKCFPISGKKSKWEVKAVEIWPQEFFT